MVTLDEVDTCNLRNPTSCDVTDTTSITVRSYRNGTAIRCNQGVVISWAEESEATVIGYILTIESLSDTIEGIDKLLSSSISTREERGARAKDRASLTTRNSCASASSSSKCLHCGNVEAFSEGFSKLLSVDATDIVVVLQFIDISNECRRDEDVINRDDTLSVLDCRQVTITTVSDILASCVVTCCCNTSCRELSGLTTLNRANHVQVFHNVLLLESSQDFSREYFEEELISASCCVYLSQAGRTCVAV